MLASRFTLVAALCLAACGPSTANTTPPLYAPLTAGAGDAEAAPAHRLPDDTHPLAYTLTIDISPDQPSFRGVVSIDVQLDRPRETIYLHAKDLHPESARVLRLDAQGRGDGESVLGQLATVTPSGLAALKLPQPVGPGTLRIEIAYRARFGDKLDGLYRVKAGDAYYAFTQFEAVSARQAFPCFDEPRFKTPFEVTLRVPQALKAIANTKEVSSKDVPGGLREVRFAKTEKLPTYLVAMAVGPLDVVDAPAVPASDVRKTPLPLRGIAAKGRGAELAYALRETPKLIASLEQYLGIAYPYDKLDLIAVPDFAAGAMENAGAITFRDMLLLLKDDAPEQQRRLFALVNAHELAHQWFGNLVTMPWWDDVWLNEAFATWMESHVIRDVYPAYEEELTQVGSAHYAMDTDSNANARQIRQPIESDHDIENAFDGITYSKGAAVISMFERYLGADKFRAGLQLYLSRHAFGNATARELTAALAEASGQAVQPAFYSFLEQPGVPLIGAELDCKSAPALLLSQTRYLPLGSPLLPGGVPGASGATPQGKADSRWQVPVCVRLGYGTETKDVCQLLSEPSMRVPLEGACPSWLMPNAAAAGYYRWSLSPERLRGLVQSRSVLSMAEQMSLAASVQAAMRAGALDGGEALSAQLELVASPKRQVADTALGALLANMDDLLDDATRPLLRAELGKALRAGYEKYGLFSKDPAENGDAKLARSLYVRGLAFAARDPALREELAKLGEAQLELGTHPRLAELPSELRELALAAAVQVRGKPVIDRALERLFASQDGLDRGRLLGAVTSQKDPALTNAVMALSLDERLRENERYMPIFGQSSQVETREQAFAWLVPNFDALRGKLGPHAGAALFRAPRELCSETAAASVQASLGPKATTVTGAPRELGLALESIRLCAALSAAQGPKAQAALKARGGKAPATATQGGKAQRKTPPPAAR
jgi:alanyl aminopeptidase